MRTSIWITVVVAITFNVLASIYLRRGMANLGIESVLSFPLIVPIGMSMLFYLFAFISYGLTLNRMPLALAYAVITFGTQVSLTIVGSVLGDRLSHAQLAGLAVAMVGIVIMLGSTARGGP